MGMIEIASGDSLWRGIDYYNEKMVKSYRETDRGIYEGTVSGSGGKEYAVKIDINHPRKSSCNCPFADGRRVVCKHMIALYFTAEPEALDDFYKQVEKWEEEEEEIERQHEADLEKYVKSLSKAELQERLLDALHEIEYYKNNSRW